MDEQNIKKEQAEVKEKKTTTQTKKKTNNTKPAKFKETEKMAKDLIEANGDNYYEWLDEKHKEFIFNKMIDNQENVIDALKK